jgi:hypothetical protein
MHALRNHLDRAFAVARWRGKHRDGWNGQNFDARFCQTKSQESWKLWTSMTWFVFGRFEHQPQKVFFKYLSPAKESSKCTPDAEGGQRYIPRGLVDGITLHQDLSITIPIANDIPWESAFATIEFHIAFSQLWTGLREPRLSRQKAKPLLGAPDPKAIWPC